MMSSETELVNRILNGDVNSFATIVNNYKDLVYNIIIKIVHNQQDAEDIAQDVFIKAYNNLGKYKFKSKLSTWLFSIAYNEAISFTRKNSTVFITIPDNYDANNSNEDDNIEYSSYLLETLKTEMAKLNDDDNLLLTLFYKMNNSIEEIAQITGMSSSNVKVKLFRIRKKLLTKLNETQYGK